MDGLNIAEKINGTVENVVFRNDENDYTVLEISDDDNNLITAVGIMPPAAEGELVTLVGEWTYHKEFGKQFSFLSYEKRLPEDTERILQYLSSRIIKGVGPVTALKIVNKYGADTFDVIANHPEWLADIPGINMKRAAEISKSFSEQNDMRGVMMFLSGYIGVGDVTRVYKRFGKDSVGIVTQNPYILCETSFGIPFERADELALSLGIPMDDEERILSGMIYLLCRHASGEGHTCMPKEIILRESVTLLGVPESTLSERLDYFIKTHRLAEYDDGNSLLVMTSDAEAAENFIVKKIERLSATLQRLSYADISALIQSAEANLGIEYAQMQREALFAAISSGVSVITGGPGTGKTTIIKALLRIFKTIGHSVVLAAPTGRAAKRMSEATSEEAKTVHRMLEMERTATGEIRFNRNEAFPLEEKVIIVDEASMLDLFLTEALMRALRGGARLVLIGDADQLPSVGAGNVLSDIIASGRIKTVMLTEIFRQSRESLIVTNAHRINNGEAPLLNSTDGDFFFVRRESERDIASAVSELITKRLPRAYGEDVRGQIQVITPSRKGAGGVEVLNAELQQSLNPKNSLKRERMAHGTLFREGDRVMQTVNNYELEWERDGATGIGIFNGDIGVIRLINLAEQYMNIAFDDRVVRYGFSLLDDLELAYAITVHKSQGSEYPVVIVPMYSCAPMLLSRNLLYTAVTRARNMVILVGRSDIPARMAANKREFLRYTTLSRRLMSIE